MFTTEFEKTAVSMGWVNKRVTGGLAERLGVDAKKLHKMTVKDSAKASHGIHKAMGMDVSEMQSYAISKKGTTGDLRKAGISPRGIYSAVNKSIPKMKAGNA